jgi:drug/metabolite transporter (DMT)-like permease
MKVAVAFKLVSTVFAAAMAIIVARLASTVPVGEIICFRGVFAVPVLYAYVAAHGEWSLDLSRDALRGHATRALFGCTGLACFYISLRFLPTTTALAVGFLTPIFVAMIVAVRAGQASTWRLWLGLAIGLAGALIILDPSTTGYDAGEAIGVGIGVIGAAFTAAAILHAKSLLATQSSGAVALWFSIWCAAAGLVTLPVQWVALDCAALLQLAACGVIGATGHVTMNEALKRAPAERLAVLDYAPIAWAMLFEVAIIGRSPGLDDIAGATLIVLAGFMIGSRGGAR